MSKEIESELDNENWESARKLILQGLETDPDSHWLYTRLSITYYEQKKYKKALKYSDKALELQPSCPLALWDKAGALDMLDNLDEAIAIYKKLIRRGIERIAFGKCGEGLAWSRGLVADCWYRLALCHLKNGNNDKATKAIERHLDLRGPGCRSIYSLKEVRVSHEKIKKNKQF